MWCSRTSVDQRPHLSPLRLLPKRQVDSQDKGEVVRGGEGRIFGIGGFHDVREALDLLVLALVQRCPVRLHAPIEEDERPLTLVPIDEQSVERLPLAITSSWTSAKSSRIRQFAGIVPSGGSSRIPRSISPWL